MNAPPAILAQNSAEEGVDGAVTTTMGLDPVVVQPTRAVALIMRHRGLLFGFVSQGLQYGGTLLLLPLMATRLTPAEIGVWYLFVTVQSLAMIADFGFQPTFARNISLAFSGVEEIRPQGIAERRGEEPNYLLVAQTLHAAKRLYLMLAVLVLALLLTAGLGYVSHVASAGGLNVRGVQASWTVLAAGTALSIYFQWINPVLIGGGRVEQNYIYSISVRGGFALLGTTALLGGGGIMALAVAQLVSLLVARIVATNLMRPITRELPIIRHDSLETRGLLAVTWPNASRLGISAVAGFLIMRFAVFTVSTFGGLEAAASYAISLQLVSASMSVAQLPLQFATPGLVDASARDDRVRLRQMTLRLTAVYVGLFILGAMVVVVLGPMLLNAIHSRVRLLERPLLLLMCVIFLLEGVHWTSAFALMAGNRVPFVRPAVISGIAVALGSSLAGYLGLGVAGVLLCQGIVQLAYNNWRWPLLMFQQTRP